MAQNVTSSEDPRVTRTRELIEQSFYELLMEKSLHKLTIGEIAARARINRATFYAHFEDKYALYRHVVRTTFAQILAENLPVEHDEPALELRALVLSACLFFAQLNATCPPPDRQTRPLVEVQVQTQLKEYVMLWLQKNAHHVGALAAPVDVTAEMVSWAVFGAGLDWEGGRQSAAALAEQLYALVARMVGLSQEAAVDTNALLEQVHNARDEELLSLR